MPNPPLRITEHCASDLANGFASPRTCLLPFGTHLSTTAQLIKLSASLVLSGVIVVSCASAPKGDPERLAGLRYGEECAPARAKARTRDPQTLTDSDRPKVFKVFVVTTPPPASERGKSIDVLIRVDSTGAVVKNGVSFTGITDAKFASLIRTTMARTLYRPATIDGCAVEGIARSTLSWSQ